MDRPEFNLMSYPSRGHAGKTRGLNTFDPGKPDARVAAVVVAPPGSDLWRHNKRAGVKLRVPRPDRPEEFLVLDPDQALAAARSGAHGLGLKETP